MKDGMGSVQLNYASNYAYLHSKCKLVSPSLSGFLLQMYLFEEVRYQVKLARPGAAAIRLEYVAVFPSLLCLCVSVLLSAPVVLCLQELKLVLDPVTGIRSCEFQLLRRGLSWEKHKRRTDKKLVESTRWRDTQRKLKWQIKNKNIKVG